MQPIALGIDVGSSSIKSVGCDLDEQNQLFAIHESLDAKVVSGVAGRYEEDPILIRDRTHSLIRRVATFAKEQNYEITRIAFTGQMHGGLFVDSGLNPLSNFITWQDKRADEVEASSGKKLIARIRERVSTATWLETGGEIYTGFWGATVCWFMSHDRIPERASKIIGIYDWLSSALCGNEVITDPSSAAAWGICSIKEGRWSDEIVDGLNIPRSLLPEVRKTGVSVGQVSVRSAEALGLSQGTEVVSGCGDTQASYFGSGCKRDEVLINIGTGSQCMFERQGFATFPGTDTRPLSSDRCLITIPTLAGGLAFALMANFLNEVVSKFGGNTIGRDELYARMCEIATEAPEGTEGVGVSPLFNGSRKKGEDLRGEITGLDPKNFSTANILRATLEGMINELAEPYFAIPEMERPHTGIIGSGNGIRLNPLLQTIVEKQFKLPIKMSTKREEAAYGAARVAAGRF